MCIYFLLAASVISEFLQKFDWGIFNAAYFCPPSLFKANRFYYKVSGFIQVMQILFKICLIKHFKVTYVIYTTELSFVSLVFNYLKINLAELCNFFFGVDKSASSKINHASLITFLSKIVCFKIWSVLCLDLKVVLQYLLMF